MKEIETIPKNYKNLLGWMQGAEWENQRDKEVIYRASFKMNFSKINYSVIILSTYHAWWSNYYSSSLITPSEALEWWSCLKAFLTEIQLLILQFSFKFFEHCSFQSICTREYHSTICLYSLGLSMMDRLFLDCYISFSPDFHYASFFFPLAILLLNSLLKSVSLKLLCV